MFRNLSLTIFLLFFISGCSSLSPHSFSTKAGNSSSNLSSRRASNPQAKEAVLFALGLIDIDYHFGGRNPEAGLDCSGMVIYVYNQVAELHLSGSAADIAKKSYSVSLNQLEPGDLVFFNTSGRSFSHVGIYIGDNKFVHAPNSRGKVRIDHLDHGYFKDKLESAKTLF